MKVMEGRRTLTNTDYGEYTGRGFPLCYSLKTTTPDGCRKQTKCVHNVPDWADMWTFCVHINELPTSLKIKNQ